MTIKFIYTDNGTYLEVQTEALHIGDVVDEFRLFLMHVGYHSANIERVQLVGEERTQALPKQLDRFDNELPTGEALT